MSDDHELDHVLTRRFAALRESDARTAPDFDVLLARTRNVADASTLQVEHTTSPARRDWRRLVLYAAGPMLTAAGLGAVWLNASRRAEREFTEAVSEWSQTSVQVLHSPTDGLLVLPGNEYLRTVPAVGPNVRDPRRGS